jgi:hypothetical protein
MDNEMKYGNWIPFKKPLKGRHSFDGLTITKFKKIGLPQDFCLKNNIEKYQYAVFYFDGTIPAIGIEFTTIKQPGCRAFIGGASLVLGIDPFSERVFKVPFILSLSKDGPLSPLVVRQAHHERGRL